MKSILRIRMIIKDGKMMTSMKKFIYVAAAVAAMAACSKEAAFNEETSVKAEGVSLNISGSVISAETKAVFDGDKHIAWQIGDRLMVALGTSADAENAIIPNINSLYATPSNTVFMNAALVSAADATFSVSYRAIPEAALENDVYIFGMYPASAFKPTITGNALTDVTVELPAAQNPTATSWDPKADVMVAMPSVVSLEKSAYDEQYKEYTVAASAAPMTFAHVFGFGKISFAGLPESMMNSVVKSIVIEDTDNTKSFAGRYKIDLNKSIVNNPARPGDQYYASSTISLTAKNETLLKDFNAMFVCNPGTYNVKVTVSTLAGTFVATRSGLTINRAGLAAPTLNYKEGVDQCESAPVVDITDLEWSMTFTSSMKCISSSTNNYTSTSRPFWGPEAKKMYFTVKYPGSSNELYPSYEGWGTYVQKFNNMSVDGGEIDLVSDNAFRGVKQVKIVTGILDDDVDGVVSAYLVNGSESTLLGTATIKGNKTAYDGTNGVTCAFNAPADKGEGVLKLVWNHFNNAGDEQVIAESGVYFKVYIAEICINAAPSVTLEKEAVTVPAAGESAQLGCTVVGADSAPEISCSESWLTATLADGKLSYTAAENTGDKRTATITITARGLGNTVKTVAVTQKSANEKEYTIKITPADVNAALEAAKAAYDGTVTPESTKLTYTVDFHGVAADGTVDSEAVTIKFSEVYYDTEFIYVSEQYQAGKYAVTNVTPLSGYVSYMGAVSSDYLNSGHVKPIVSAVGGSYEVISSYSTNNKWSLLDGITYERGEDSFYTSSVACADETAAYFMFLTYNTKTKFKSLEIRYIK